jgi:hypothetical protein
MSVGGRKGLEMQFKTIEELEQAVLDGENVHWVSDRYVVSKEEDGRLRVWDRYNFSCGGFVDLYDVGEFYTIPTV